MINVIIAYDDIDNDSSDKIGVFFLQCYYDLLKYFNDSKYSLQRVGRSELNKENIENTISTFKEKPFICLAFSHGTKNTLECNEGAYIDSTNCYFFGNSFFYTFSCNAGEELGERLVTNDCKSFIGYKDIASVILTDLPYFIECANYGIKCFFENQNSLETYNSMLDKYEEMVDKLREQGSIDEEIISTLTSNKNALILLGREDVTLDEFVISN